MYIKIILCTNGTLEKLELTFLDIFQILTDSGQSSPTTIRYRNIVRVVEVNYSDPIINLYLGKELIFLTACEKKKNVLGHVQLSD
jgi:hypothetical protein